MLVGFSIIFSLSSFSQNKPTSEYQLKAAFIYNFTRFIVWPSEAFKGSTAPFIIGIMADSEFSSYVEDMVKGEKLGERPIVVQHINTTQDINQCKILFISESEAIKVKELLPVLNRKGILTVSDATNFAEWGGIIRFFKDENKLRLQININEVKASQLTISSKLLSLSNIYSVN